MGTEDWVLKGTKLITNAKKQRLKIRSRVWKFQKYNIKEKKKKRTQNHKNYKNIYMKFAFKKYGLFFFFCKVIVG